MLSPDAKLYWCISVRGRYIGKCEATLADIRKACGSWITIVGNHVDVFCPPQKGA